MNFNSYFWNLVRVTSIVAAGTLLDTSIADAQSNVQPISTTELEPMISKANQLAATPAGKTYVEQFRSAVTPTVLSTQACAPLVRADTSLSILWVIAADGTVDRVFYSPDDSGTRCAVSKLANVRVPVPPRAKWPVYATMSLHPGSIDDALPSPPPH